MTCQTAGGEILGIPARVPDDGRVYLHNQRLGRVVPRDRSKSDQDFLYWLYLSVGFRQFLFSTASGTKILHTSPKRIEAFEFNLPPLPEQRRIAAVLGALDDKIELNRKMNRTLEAMAQAIFKSWFVDFDGHTDLVDSELGPIPRGWEVNSLSKQASLMMESIKPADEPETVWHHYSIPAFDSGRRAVLDLGSSIKSGKYLVPGEAVLVSKLNPRFPRVWLPDITASDVSICSTEFMPFVSIQGELRPYLYDLLRSAPIQEAIQSRVTGSTGSRQRVKPREIAAMPVLKPAFTVRMKYSCLVKPVHDRQLLSLRESATLAVLRDTLLPKLISGEIRVPEAERAVEQVVA